MNPTPLLAASLNALLNICSALKSRQTGEAQYHFLKVVNALE
jgi:hypothetical protein